MFRDDASIVPDATDAAPSRGFVPAVGSRDSLIYSPLALSLIPAWSSCPAAGEKCLLAVIECPEGSVVSSVDGVLASVGPRADLGGGVRRGLLYWSWRV